jgi:ABC-type multidrug transport system fused ATPase/permease subunit
MRMAKPEATDEEMKQVLEDIGAWNFLKSGLDTTVGDASARFSGGQLQQIAVARAFIKKPKILLLDEATSAMDQAAVEALLRTISSYRETVGGLTVVIVAFRIVTFKTMNKIITLRKDGTMGPVGTHEDIMNQYPDSAYAKYCLQLAGSESARRRVQVKMTDIEQRMAANIGGLFITPTKDA